MSERDYWDQQAALDPHFAAWAAEGDGVDDFLAQMPTDLYGDILDLGCGPGRILVPLAERFPEARFHGVDVSRPMLDAAAERCPYNVTLLQCDGRTLPKLPTIDFVYSFLMFQHIPDGAVQSYLNQVSALLEPDGRAVFQYVVGEEDSPMNRHRSMQTFTDWCDEAGLALLSHSMGYLYPNWGWAKAVKRCSLSFG